MLESITLHRATVRTVYGLLLLLLLVKQSCELTVTISKFSSGTVQRTTILLEKLVSATAACRA
jgi:hypothetical protein